MLKNIMPAKWFAPDLCVSTIDLIHGNGHWIFSQHNDYSVSSVENLFMCRVYSEEQQEALGVNEFGNYMCVISPDIKMINAGSLCRTKTKACY